MRRRLMQAAAQFGLSSRGAPSTTLPPDVVALLPAFGDAWLQARASGGAVTDPRFEWGAFFAPVAALVREGRSGAVLDKLHAAALNAADRRAATIGAYALFGELEPKSRDHRFLALLDDTLEHIRAAGLSSGHLNRYEADRWIELHGDLRSSFDNLVEVEVPEALARPLRRGEVRRLALTEPLPLGNAFFAEHRDDGTFIVFSERIYSLEDPTRSRYEEQHLGVFTAYEDLLRALGGELRTPTHWFDDDLEPYFPHRRA
jgi:hypothetical protein